MLSPAPESPFELQTTDEHEAAPEHDENKLATQDLPSHVIPLVFNGTRDVVAEEELTPVTQDLPSDDISSILDESRDIVDAKEDAPAIITTRDIEDVMHSPTAKLTDHMNTIEETSTLLDLGTVLEADAAEDSNKGDDDQQEPSPTIAEATKESASHNGIGACMSSDVHVSPVVDKQIPLPVDHLNYIQETVGIDDGLDVAALEEEVPRLHNKSDMSQEDSPSSDAVVDSNLDDESYASVLARDEPESDGAAHIDTEGADSSKHQSEENIQISTIHQDDKGASDEEPVDFEPRNLDLASEESESRELQPTEEDTAQVKETASTFDKEDSDDMKAISNLSKPLSKSGPEEESFVTDQQEGLGEWTEISEVFEVLESTSEPAAHVDQSDVHTEAALDQISPEPHLGENEHEVEPHDLDPVEASSSEPIQAKEDHIILQLRELERSESPAPEDSLVKNDDMIPEPRNLDALESLGHTVYAFPHVEIADDDQDVFKPRDLDARGTATKVTEKSSPEGNPQGDDNVVTESPNPNSVEASQTDSERLSNEVSAEKDDHDIVEPRDLDVHETSTKVVEQLSPKASLEEDANTVSESQKPTEASHNDTEHLNHEFVAEKDDHDASAPRDLDTLKGGLEITGELDSEITTEQENHDGLHNLETPETSSKRTEHLSPQVAVAKDDHDVLEGRDIAMLDTAPHTAEQLSPEAVHEKGEHHNIVPRNLDILEASPEHDHVLENPNINQDQDLPSSQMEATKDEDHVHHEPEHQTSSEVEKTPNDAKEELGSSKDSVHKLDTDNSDVVLSRSEDEPLDGADALGDENSVVASDPLLEVDDSHGLGASSLDTVLEEDKGYESGEYTPREVIEAHRSTVDKSLDELDQLMTGVDEDKSVHGDDISARERLTQETLASEELQIATDSHSAVDSTIQTHADDSQDPEQQLDTPAKNATEEQAPLLDKLDNAKQSEQNISSSIHEETNDLAKDVPIEAVHADYASQQDMTISSDDQKKDEDHSQEESEIHIPETKLPDETIPDIERIDPVDEKSSQSSHIHDEPEAHHISESTSRKEIAADTEQQEPVNDELSRSSTNESTSTVDTSNGTSRSAPKMQRFFSFADEALAMDGYESEEETDQSEPPAWAKPSMPNEHTFGEQPRAHPMIRRATQENDMVDSSGDDGFESALSGGGLHSPDGTEADTPRLTDSPQFSRDSSELQGMDKDFSESDESRSANLDSHIEESSNPFADEAHPLIVEIELSQHQNKEIHEADSASSQPLDKVSLATEHETNELPVPVTLATAIADELEHVKESISAEDTPTMEPASVPDQDFDVKSPHTDDASKDTPISAAEVAADTKKDTAAKDHDDKPTPQESVVAHESAVAATEVTQESNIGSGDTKSTDKLLLEVINGNTTSGAFTEDLSDIHEDTEGVRLSAASSREPLAAPVISQSIDGAWDISNGTDAATSDTKFHDASESKVKSAQEIEAGDTMDEGSAKDGAPLNGSTGPSDHSVNQESVTAPDSHRTVEESRVNRFAESPINVLYTDSESEYTDSDYSEASEEESDAEDEEEDEEDSEDDESDGSNEEDDDEQDDDPAFTMMPGQAERSSSHVLQGMPSYEFGKPKMLDPFSETTNEQIDTSSSISSGLYSSLVDTIKSDSTTNQMGHRLPHLEDEYPVPVKVAEADQSTIQETASEKDVPFEDTFSDHQPSTHARSHTADTVPSMKSHDQSDAESSASETPESPIQETTSSEPQIVSPPRPLQERRGSQASFSPLRAEFDPTYGTNMNTYPKYITPKASQANLKAPIPSPRSPRHERPVLPVPYVPHVIISQSPNRARGTTSPTSTRYAHPTIPPALPDEKHVPSVPPPAPPVSTNSFFQRTRSLFERSGSPTPASGSAASSPETRLQKKDSTVLRSRPSSLYQSELPASVPAGMIEEEGEEIEFMPRSLDEDGKPPSPMWAHGRSGSIGRVENDLNVFVPSKDIKTRSVNPFAAAIGGERDKESVPLLEKEGESSGVEVGR